MQYFVIISIFLTDDGIRKLSDIKYLSCEKNGVLRSPNLRNYIVTNNFLKN